jgi:hypothetical protein
MKLNKCQYFFILLNVFCSSFLIFNWNLRKALSDVEVFVNLNDKGTVVPELVTEKLNLESPNVGLEKIKIHRDLIPVDLNEVSNWVSFDFSNGLDGDEASQLSLTREETLLVSKAIRGAESNWMRAMQEALTIESENGESNLVYNAKHFDVLNEHKNLLSSLSFIEEWKARIIAAAYVKGEVFELLKSNWHSPINTADAEQNVLREIFLPKTPRPTRVSLSYVDNHEAMTNGSFVVTALKNKLASK